MRVTHRRTLRELRERLRAASGRAPASHHAWRVSCTSFHDRMLLSVLEKDATRRPGMGADARPELVSLGATMVKLLVLDGPMRGREFPLVQSPAVIGRDAGADVPLAMDPRVAPFHCQIRFDHGQYWLEDLGSPRGTRVYGKPY